ncbi:hypothetical protein A3Q56_02295 [Intoshia linei]|uniref:Uncharacterized protein n=1 Tax=Intoshia linei TaxID=1819745 RepID=A0A177B8G4_9BILA|nr:hypothetical protein A3Q56_02295 [Intoshia linei]
MKFNSNTSKNSIISYKSVSYVNAKNRGAENELIKIIARAKNEMVSFLSQMDRQKWEAKYLIIDIKKCLPINLSQVDSKL